MRYISLSLPDTVFKHKPNFFVFGSRAMVCQGRELGRDDVLKWVTVVEAVRKSTGSRALALLALLYLLVVITNANVDAAIAVLNGNVTSFFFDSPAVERFLVGVKLNSCGWFADAGLRLVMVISTHRTPSPEAFKLCM